MKTLDLRKLNQPDKDSFRIAIRLERKQDYNELKIMHYGDDHFRVVDISKSLRYKCHAPDFSWGYDGDGCYQLALAICLEVYSVSDALKCYKRFMYEYIRPIDQKARLFISDLVVPVDVSELL